MNVKIAILSVLLCLAGVSQSIHLHPNGQSLVFSQGTNTYATDRHKAWARIRQFEAELNGLKQQLDFAQKCLREHPPRIQILEQEIATQKLHLEMMRIMGVTNAPSESVALPPSPPALPVNPSVQNGLPPAYRPDFVPRRDVVTARE